MKSAKVFKQGNSQAVRLPKEFRLPGDEVFIKRSGDHVVLIPKPSKRWQHVRACLSKFKGEFERSQPSLTEERDWLR